MEKEEKQNQRQRAVLLGQDCNSQLEEFTDFLGKVLVLKIKQIHQFINELKKQHIVLTTKTSLPTYKVLNIRTSSILKLWSW